jgi:hypothetical protein
MLPNFGQIAPFCRDFHHGKTNGSILNIKFGKLSLDTVVYDDVVICSIFEHFTGKNKILK